MLILTGDVANHVRGLTIPGQALVPIPLADGTFALPEAVLNDPAHASKKDYLIANADIRLDQTISPSIRTDPDNPLSSRTGGDWSTDLILNAACAYNSSWSVGELITVEVP